MPQIQDKQDINNNLQYRMLPYRPPQKKQKPQKQMRLKSIPSLQLIHTLNDICQNSQNRYEQKNHVLTINDIYSFEEVLSKRYGRSLRSFERQLKKLGYRLLKNKYSEYDNQEQLGRGNYQVKIYKWKGKKQLLIDQQLNLMEKCLKQRRKQIESTKDQIKTYKKQIDSKIQSILFTMIVDFNSKRAKQSLSQIIIKIKQAVNGSQTCIRNIINYISLNLGNQLELYKLLMYKQGVSENRIQDREEGEGEGEYQCQGQGQGYYGYGEVEQNGAQCNGEEQNDSNQDQDEVEGEAEGEGENNRQNHVIQQQSNSKNSSVSIQMDQNIKAEIKKQTNMK